jgi:UDP-N-acetylglucosamine 3-dehydrogenase
MQKQKGIVVIGVGAMGTNHCRLLHKNKLLLGIFDKDRQRAIQLAKKYGTIALENPGAIVRAKPNGAIVAVSTPHHKAIALELIAAKIPTLVEKPLATNSKEAKAIISIAKKLNIFLMIGMVERYNPVVQKVKKDIQANIFGKISQILAIRVGISPPPTPPRMVDLDLGIHDIDTISYLVDELPTVTHSSLTRERNDSISDSVSMTMRYKGFTASIISNWLSHTKIRKMYIFGEKNSAEVNLLSQSIDYFPKFYPTQTKTMDPFTFFKNIAWRTKRVAISKKEPLEVEHETFVSNLDAGYLDDYCINGLQSLQIIERSKKI